MVRTPEPGDPSFAPERPLPLDELLAAPWPPGGPDYHAVHDHPGRAMSASALAPIIGREEVAMLLVPRQLQRAGMTGTVPYYGGRFTPAQAYAASHPGRPPVRPASPPQARQLQALQHLLDTGVITGEEFRELRARVAV